MAPKKVEAAPSKEEPVATEAPVEEAVEQRSGSFVLPNGSTYIGQYNYTKIVRAPAAADVQGTAMEPLAESESLQIHGTGKLLFGPELFDGAWRNGNMVKGKHVFPSGAVYDGYFMHNKFHGMGKYSWADGREYDGLFANGQMHGEGRYYHFTDGNPSEFTGISVRGKFKSGHEEQAGLKAEFAAEYGAPMIASARAALQKGDGAWPELLVAPGLEQEWLAGRTLEQAADRAASPDQLGEDEQPEELAGRVQEAREQFPELNLLPGPCPTAEDFPLLAALVQGLEAPPAVEGEEPAPPATTVTLVESPHQMVRRPQLQYLGQCVELAGAPGSCTLCNVGASRGAPGCANDPDAVGDYDVGQAVWRLVAAQKALTEE